MMSVDFPVPSLRALLVPACAVFLFAGCGESAPSNGARGQAPAAVVTTAVVAPSPWQDTISALGTVKARESVEVTAKVSETVERVHFESGDEVEAGAAAAGGAGGGGGGRPRGRAAVPPWPRAGAAAADLALPARHPTGHARRGAGAGGADARRHRRPPHPRAVRRPAGDPPGQPGR